MVVVVTESEKETGFEMMREEEDFEVVMRKKVGEEAFEGEDINNANSDGDKTTIEVVGEIGLEEVVVDFEMVQEVADGIEAREMVTNGE